MCANAARLGSSVTAVDRHVGARIRERRIALDLSQLQLAQMIGATYQRIYKFESGANRVSSGILFAVAEALGVGVGFFYDPIGAALDEPDQSSRQTALPELARNFIEIRDHRLQEALCALARAMRASSAEKGFGEILVARVA